jgi:S-adenosylmethionine:tRNA ribosyltransferase-isomerase
MRTDELDFDLPEELIAQTPAHKRSDSRLLHFRRQDAISHRQFQELPALLQPGDLLVFNDARVLPARFSLRKATGGHVEGLFLCESSPGLWSVMLRNVGNPHGTMRLTFLDAPEIAMEVLAKDDQGNYRVRIDPISPAAELLGRLGRMPLPPYIRRDKDHDLRDADDRDRYQTVYAQGGHAVAAPTAGLHFTPELLAALDTRNIQHACVTLNVGLGTFKPVSASTLDEHRMHVESYTIPAETAKLLNLAKRERRRIIAVGTTSARVLESQAAGDHFQPCTSETGIFIYPPYHWKHVDALVTNFHLPRSTLIALVAAMVGLDEQRRLYRTAIEQRYRFFSYGDAMFIE